MIRVWEKNTTKRTNEEYITTTNKEKEYHHGHNQTLILSGQAYYNFINAIKSPATRKLYDVALKRFMGFINIEDVDSLLYLNNINDNNQQSTASPLQPSYAARSISSSPPRLIEANSNKYTTQVISN
jgi:hypothetical protein